MANLPVEVWILMGIIAAAAMLAILGAAAHARREECRLHDLKVRVHELRSAYQRRLAELRRGIGDVPVIEAEVIEEPEVVRAAA